MVTQFCELYPQHRTVISASPVTVGALDHVRYPEQSGEYRLTESFTARDPEQTSEGTGVSRPAISLPDSTDQIAPMADPIRLACLMHRHWTPHRRTLCSSVPPYPLGSAALSTELMLPRRLRAVVVDAAGAA